MGEPENGSNKPIGNRYGKEGVNGSSPLEGFAFFLLSAAFHRDVCGGLCE
jgi:hypothetical protein